MNNLYNLAGVAQTPATLITSETNKTAIDGASSGNSLPQQAANDAAFNPSTNPRDSGNTELIEQLANDLSVISDSLQRSLSFSVNQDTGDTVIVVRDSQTEEVVRQIPSESSLQLAQNLNRIREALESAGSLPDDSALDFIGSKGNLLDASA